MRGFLGQAVAGEKVDVGESLRDVLLGFLVEVSSGMRSRARGGFFKTLLGSWRRFPGLLTGSGAARGPRSARAELIQALDETLVVLVSLDEFDQRLLGAGEIASRRVRI